MEGNRPVTAELEFWFEFGSPYSYLSAMRIEKEAQKRNVPVAWKPFLLGPVFQENGWDSSPFNEYPAKGRHMWRDMERRAEKYGLEFHRLSGEGGAAFPQNGLLAARIALIGLDSGWGQSFSKSVFVSEFVDGADISQPQHLGALALRAGAPENCVESASASENKDRLKAAVRQAMDLGIFGAPSFVVAGELFWGDDRLEDAIEWAAVAK